MKNIEIKATQRKELGKKATKLARKQGIVPCVMYGNEKNIHFEAHENVFRHIIYTPNVYLVNFDIDGKKITGVMKDIQFHPVTDKILHIDFQEVVEGKTISLEMPIEVTGSSIGVKNGGRLRLRRRQLNIRALTKDIPETLKVDVTKLNIGQTIQVKDLSYPNLTLLDPPRAMVMGVVSSRVAKNMLPEEEGIEDTIDSTAEAENAAQNTPASEQSE